MAKVWEYDAACAMCGRLYGNLLARDADPSGYQYCVERLAFGTASVRDMVREICTSDEFRESFVMNQTPNELAKRLILRMAKEPRADPRVVKSLAITILEGDWRDVVRRVIDGERYSAMFGDDDLPLWT